MNYLEFNTLPLCEQLDQVIRYGNPLTECRKYNLRLQLFELDNLYVEIIALQSSDELVAINSFEETAYLEPYLQGVDIEGLFRA